MIKKISKSFIPFLIVLVALMLGTHYLDIKALDNSKNPTIINVSDVSQESILEEDGLFLSEVNDILKSDSLFIEANQLFDKRKYNSSKKAFTTLLSLYPDEAIIYRYLGVIEYKKNDFVEAEKLLIKSLELNSASFSAHSSLALLYAKSAKPHKAEKHYIKAILLQPNKRSTYLNYGILLNKKREYEKVIPLMDSVINKGGGKLKAKALYYKGYASLHLNDTATAKELFLSSIDYYPQYSLPRIELAFLEPIDEDKESKLKQVLLLNENNASAHFHLAQFYKNQGNSVLSEKHSALAVKLNPNEQEYIQFLGDYYISINRFEKAKQIFGDLFFQDSLNPLFSFYKGKLAYKQKDYSNAEVWYTKSIQQSDNSYAEAFLNRGNTLSKLNRKEEAISDYLSAISLKKNYREAYYNLGSLYSDQNNKNLALAYFDSTLQIKPNYSKAWYNRGKLFMSDKNWSEAIKSFNKAVEYDKSYLKAQLNLAISYSRSDKNDLAIETYQSILDAHPNYVKAWYNLGLTYKREKKYEDALECYSKALQIDQEHDASRLAMFKVYKSLKDNENMLIQLNELIENNTAKTEYRYELAEIYLNQKNYSKAAEQFQKIIQVDPYEENAYSSLQDIYSNLAPNMKKQRLVEEAFLKYFPDEERVYELARSYHKAKKYEKAILLYDKAIELGRNDDWVHYWKGKALESNGKIKEAGNEYLIALKIDSKHKYSLFRMGVLQEQYGNKEKAVKYYKRLEKLYPDFALSKNINEKINYLTNEN